MKKFLQVVFAFISLLWFSANSYSQCTPDPGCVDIDDPGQICPAVLPDATQGVAYSQVMTIIPPSTALVGGYEVNLFKIVLTDIGNLPPGLSYQTNATNNEFLVGSSYCALLEGVPTDTGTYKLKITVDVYIDVLGYPVNSGSQVDSTSMSIHVLHNLSLDQLTSKTFRIENMENPFSYQTNIGFVCGKSDIYNLDVINCTGEILYSEKINSKSGENYFNFKGEKLLPGIYIVRISGNGNSVSRKLIKTL